MIVKQTLKLIQPLSALAFLFLSSYCYSQSTFDLGDPNIIYKDINGRVMTKDSVMAFASKGNFNIKKTEIGNGKTEIILFRKTLEESQRESNIAIEKLKHKLVGNTLPHFHLKKISGGSITEKSFAGKVTVINFWFTGCQPCVQEMPELNRLATKYESVNFVAFTFNEFDEVKRFLTKHNFDYTQLPNAEEFIKALNINTYPTHMILDKNGVVKEIEIGATDDIYNRLSTLIDQIPK
jgi:thiol-disulfide isomerase/thioredoxin